MFPSNESFKQFVGARDERIRSAMVLYRKHQNSEDEAIMRKFATRILQCSLAAYVLAPFAMIPFGLCAGIPLFVFGLGLFLIGTFLSVAEDNLSGNTLNKCFAEVDAEWPGLIETMRKHKTAGLYEEWSGPTF